MQRAEWRAASFGLTTGQSCAVGKSGGHSEPQLPLFFSGRAKLGHWIWKCLCAAQQKNICTLSVASENKVVCQHQLAPTRHQGPSQLLRQWTEQQKAICPRGAHKSKCFTTLRIKWCFVKTIQAHSLHSGVSQVCGDGKRTIYKTIMSRDEATSGPAKEHPPSLLKAQVQDECQGANSKQGRWRKRKEKAL